MVIHKLKNSGQLTSKDLKTLESEFRTKEEYKKEFGYMPVTIIVKELYPLK